MAWPGAQRIPPSLWRHFWRAAVSVLVTGVGLGATALAADLRFDPPVAEFGQIYQDHVTRQQVLLMNSHTNPVYMRGITTDLPGHVRWVLDDVQVPLSEVSVMTVEIHTKTLFGLFDAVVSVYTDQAEEPVQLPISAGVDAAYEIRGEPLFFDFRADATRVRTARVVSVSGNPVALDVSRLDDPFLEFQLLDQGDDPAEQLLQVRLQGELPCGTTRRDVILPSAEKHLPPCRLAVGWFNPPPLHVYPSELRVAAVDWEQIRMLFLDQYHKNPIRILDIETPHPGIRCRIMPESTLVRRRINVYFSGLNGATSELGDIVLSTDHPDVDQIRIPIDVSGFLSHRHVPLPKLDFFLGPDYDCGCVGK